MKETYKMNMKCNNCGHEGTEEFNFGTRCSHPSICPECGCISWQATTKPKQPYGRITNEEYLLTK